MLQKIDFHTNDELPILIKQITDKGFTAIEVQNHFDGNHLVFDDGQSPEPVRDLAKEIDKIKARVETLEKSRIT